MAELLHRFFNDLWVQIAFLLVALDIALGVVDATVHGNFRFNYLADFMRNDLLGKVVPFFLVYGGYVYAKNADIVIPGIDLAVVKDAAGALMLAALGASLFNSLKDLGIPLINQLPKAIVSDDPNSKLAQPTPPPTA